MLQVLGSGSYSLARLKATAQKPTMILSFEEARRLIEEHAQQLHPHGRELLGLVDSAGRVLAEPVQADRDFPPFPRATRDGFAVRSSDVANVPITLDVIG